MKLFRHKLKITTFLLRFVQTNAACWFNRPRLNQNVSVQATSLNQHETRVKSQSSFTLLELLIVIALMTILWGVAYTVFYQSKRVFSLSDNKLEMYQYARIAIDEISRDLKGATLKDNVDYFRSFTTGTLIIYYLKNTDELMRAEYNDTSYIYGTISSSFDPSQFTYYKLTANTNYFNLAYLSGSDTVSAWDSTSGTTTGHLPDAVSITLQIYGTGTGNTLETGTFTTQIMIPYRITH